MYNIPNSLISNFISFVGGRPNSGFVNGFQNKKITNQKDIIDVCKEFYKLNTIWRGAARTSNCRKYDRAAYNRLISRGCSLNQYNPSIEKQYNKQVDTALENIANRIWMYFNGKPNTNNNQNNFDIFHCRLCTSFINDLHTARSMLPYDDISYGQAQKFVNIIFKYLTCFSDYSRFANLFSYCHMAIDTNVLWALEHWFKVPNINSGASGGFFGAKYKNTTWTNLTRTNYYSLVTDYRSALRGITGTTWSNLTLEYIIWDSLRNLPVPKNFPGFSANNGIITPSINAFYM